MAARPGDAYRRKVEGMDTTPIPSGQEFVIVCCGHTDNGRRVPCPEACPCQDWPRHAMRRTLFRGRWVRRWWRG